MSDIVERLKSGTCGQGCGTMTECVCATAEDAADEITRLRNELHLAQEWSAQVIAGQEQDIAEITRLRAEVEDLGHRLHHVHRLWANNEHALRAENERLRAVLRVYAGPVGGDNFPHWSDGYPGGVMVEWNTIDFGDAARAALEGKP